MIDKNWMWFHDHFGKYESHLHAIDHFIVQEETPFQHIEIGISPFFGKIIMIDGDVQSSEKDEHVYHEALVHTAMLVHKNPENVLIMGGGEGATLREVLKHKSVKRAVMCDIDRQAVDLFKKHLPEWHQGAFNDPRSELIHGDARAYVEKAANGEFDVIISDLTEPFDGGPSQRLFSTEFFSELARVMGDDGIYVAQASLLRILTYDMHVAIRNTAKTVLPHTLSFSAYVQAFDTPWSFVMSSVNPIQLPTNVDELVASKIDGELKFYDQDALNHMFSLPKDIKQLLNKKTEIITDDKPFRLESKAD
ncbi:MAG TPA: methyltransferase domain-containing protein [Caldisericia bacterium]|nr:methyltransferase domain-containing protein [Caldisericia bacterium]HPF49166.1 methyltransferase domain-containing protein [Caldisericia bacterium]HPI82970.1 methyltransferase domain-containing protein [Caldisericia bacterium]HPQ92197.1 methyltransferase domain-containing protein [Caldisericia bacterium]HRV74705.1 methyltransferase domain-containing protein [Caldisericia bacterium]